MPAYKVRRHIVDVVTGCLEYVDKVLVVDDACPDKSGQAVLEAYVNNPKVSVIFNGDNRGVGGAMKAGYRWAIENEYDITVKIDGDGQMNPSLITSLIEPLTNGTSDFVKGNRFSSPRSIRGMPIHRVIGNGILSLLSKVSTGYWSLSDPTNGFLAITSDILEKLELERLSDGYFFESDLLFRLSILRAKVVEFPMMSVYGSEVSNLRISRVIFTFPWMHFKNLIKRIIYNYYVRDWSIGSIELPLGLVLIVVGIVFGLLRFNQSSAVGEEVSAGEAVATAIAIILGFQLLLSFVTQDIQSEPKSGKGN